MFPGLKLTVTNKRNAFDVVMDGKTIWNGSALGPPRALKFEILESSKLHDKVVAAAKAKSG
eukprot:CAMPEP_0172765456 /NCGR_PEP_ID=MMETSP1074-20121228/179305_1 /TAXON_ID=2916 /ORGANISM="Ceratium fusus, Strain PA161109" /LENGTH=60 /DNA_ID=CAMNT_0013600401 /DNA_START=99 /DNA_END=281 /DNA_ORIENTATION=+